MTAQEIHSACLPQAKEKASLCPMDQEIMGTRVTCHVLPAQASMQFPSCEDCVRILFICSGEVAVQDAGATLKIAGRGVYI